MFFFEHLPIHTQTIGANASGAWEASYSWEGGIWRKLFLTSHDNIILSVYIFIYWWCFLFPFVYFNGYPAFGFSQKAK